jgi:sulfur-oxidizing protein SoxY
MSTAGLLLAAGTITLGEAQAATNTLDTAFKSHSLKNALQALPGNSNTVIPSPKIHLTVPEIAENGASVFVAVMSELPNTTDIYLLVAKNPNPLAASFSFDNNAIADIKLYIRMSESSAVHAVVKAGGKFYSTVQDVQVTVGGCLGA